MGSRASFTAAAPFDAGKTYTVSISGAKDLGGTAMTAPVTTTFTTAGVSACPCSLLASSATPVTSDSGDASAITVGLKFTADTDGFLTGLRYYRDAANTGVHTGTLYSATGAVLATLTFGTGDPGWQYATFATPVPITAGTTYVASTFMPNGHYSSAPGFFASPVVNSPLTGTSGTYTYGGDAFPTSSWNNGYYYVDVTFTAQDPGPPATASVPGAPSSVSAVAGDGSASISWSAPSDGGSPITGYTITPYIGATKQASTTITGSPPATAATVTGLTNGTAYTFVVTATNAIGTGPASPASPVISPTATVTDTSPVDTASSVPTTAAVTAKFSRDPSDGSVEFSLRDAAGQSIAGSTAYDSQSRLATFTPTSALTAGATYTATVTASVDGVGPMSSPAVWSFTTARPDAIPGVCPCSLFNDSDAPGTPSASDSDSVNLGVAFTPDTDGVVTGIRFYKTPGNLGPHTVGLWSASGAALGSAAVTAEGASGWQTAMFSAPVSVSAGTSYIASYRAPAGRYSYTLNQLGAQLDKSPLHTPVSAGRYAYGGVAAPLNSSSTNYFVDPIFTVAAGSAPTVTAVNPVDGSTSVPTTSTTITVRFDTTIQPGSAGITVKGSDGSVVGGSLNTEPCGFPCEFHGSRAI